MNFNSPLFQLFFLGVFTMFIFVTRSASQRVLLLILANVVFYATWNLGALPLLFGLVLITYFAAVSMRRWRHRATTVVTVAVASQAALLVVYKTGVAGEIPLGLSFCVFQCIGFLVDCHRDDSVVVPTPQRFLAAVTFFPHLPSGPLLDTRDLDRQFHWTQRWTSAEAQWSLYLFCQGLGKKALADFLHEVLSSFFVGDSTAMAWARALGYLCQLYGDFSGYSDMATGLALFLGIRLPRNFDRPFFAPSPLKFYGEAWHITLSNWIRHYLFTPLALWSARRGQSAAVAVVVSMLVMGAWHGLQWTFIVWGLYVGTLLTLWSLFLSRWRPNPASILLTNYLIAVGLVIFAAPTLTHAGQELALMHWYRAGATPYAGGLFLLAVVSCLLVFLSWWELRLFELRAQAPKTFWASVFLLSSVAYCFGRLDRTFIYFHF